MVIFKVSGEKQKSYNLIELPIIKYFVVEKIEFKIALNSLGNFFSNNREIHYTLYDVHENDCS